MTYTNAAISNPGDVLYAAATIARGPWAPAPASRRDEPAWHDVALFHKVCRQMQCSNLSTIEAALSLQTRAFHDLPAFRNFYAHRNAESAAKAVQIAKSYYLIVGPKHPSEALAEPARTRPQALILDWLDDIATVIEFLCE